MEVNSIYEGDNLEILSKFPNDSIDLIYADPPFFSNRHYEVIWDDGAEIRAFQDRWQGGIEHYISWMEPRLRECQRVLKKKGSIFLHCDWHANAHLRILMDKIFSEKNFINEIIWCYSHGGRSKKTFGRKHDTIFWYSKTSDYYFDEKAVRLPMKSGLTSFGGKLRTDKEGRQFRLVYGTKNAEGKTKYYKYYLDEGKIPEDYWTDINSIQASDPERLGYPTQKPIALLDRIIKVSSKEGDIVLDPFCGCGTTLASAQKEKRRWIGIDVSPTACKLITKRLKTQFAIKALLIKGKVDISYVKKLEPFEFQNWVVVDKFLGNVSPKKSGDMGIDGLTPQITGGYPIQVKQSEGIGRNVVDNFAHAIERAKKKKGYIVAFSFGKGAFEEVARLKNEGEFNIILRTVQDLLDGKIEE